MAITLPGLTVAVLSFGVVVCINMGKPDASDRAVIYQGAFMTMLACLRCPSISLAHRRSRCTLWTTLKLAQSSKPLRRGGFTFLALCPSAVSATHQRQKRQPRLGIGAHKNESIGATDYNRMVMYASFSLVSDEREAETFRLSSRLRITGRNFLPNKL